MQFKEYVFGNLNGGLATRPNPLTIDSASKSKRMYSPAIRNADMFYSSSIAKRRGKTKQGNSLGSPSLYATLGSPDDTTLSVNVSSTGDGAYAQKFTTVAATVITEVTVKASATHSSGTARAGYVAFYTDSGSLPGTLLGTSSYKAFAYGTTPAAITFSFTAPVSLSATTDYWVLIVCFGDLTNTVLYVRAMALGAGSANIQKTATLTPASWSSPGNYSLYGLIYEASTNGTIQGIYDYRFGSSSTQKQMAAIGGALYWNNAGTWTSLVTGLGSGQDNLWDFETVKDYLVTTDYGNNIPRVWEGASTGMMKLGYRLTPWYTANYTELSITSISGSTLTMAANQSALGVYVGKTIYLTGSATLSPQVCTIKSFATTGTAGTSTYYVTSIVIEEKIYTDQTKVRFNGATVAQNNGAGSINTSGALTCFSILQVTTLKSGGFRCAEFSMDTEAGNTSQIEFTNVKMDASTDGTEYGFDIASKATTWYMTEAFDPTVGNTGTYYKIPTANMSTGNPTANSDEAFNITSITNLVSDNTLLNNYGLEQEYFTLQIDAPKFKFLKLYLGFLFGCGNLDNPNALTYAEQFAPNIWSDFGEISGGIEPINTDDGAILSGMEVWNNILFVGKRRRLFTCQFTYNNVAPFAIGEVEGAYGILSHFSCKSVSGLGLVFMSENGPSICTGTTSKLLEGAEWILDKFEPNNSSRYNLSAMQYTTAGLNSTKKQIHWGVSSTSATTRDITLVYDYENKAFWENDVSANYYTEVTDSNFFPFVWSGDYSAQVFKMDTGTSDNGSAINWYFDTPNVYLGGAFGKQRFTGISISGAVQSSGTLYVDIFTNLSSTAVKTITYDMTNSRFKTGLFRPVGMVFEGPVRLRCRNSQLDVSAQVDGIKFQYEPIGASYAQA